MVWNDDLDDVLTDDEEDDDEPDRIFTFEVAKTNEQEENVTVRKGFTVGRKLTLSQCAAC